MTSNERATNIREYAEEMEVTIADWQKTDFDDNHLPIPKGEKRLVINALNEGGYNGTEVDLLDVLKWVKANMPELLKEIENEG